MKKCLNDGESLVQNTTFEEEFPTLLNSSPPMIVNLANSQTDWNTPTIQAQIPFIPNTGTAQPPVEKKDNHKTYLLFLLTGILFGGGLVLLTILLVNAPKNSINESANINVVNRKMEEIADSSNTNSTNTNNLSENVNIKTVSNQAENNSAETKEITNEKTDNKDLKDEAPKKKEKNNQKGFNGRVVMMNALVRIAPSMDAMSLGYLEYDSPIKIGKKAAPNSPWYRVVTRSGISGWMHGNTIEYIR